MNIIVVGAGEVGTSVSRHLVQEGHNITVIDRDLQQVARIRENIDVMTYQGSGSSMRVLREAGVAQAEMLIAVSNNDEVNMLSAIIAKRMGVKTVVARTSDPDQVDPHVGFSNDVLDVDLLICPEVLTAAELSRIVRSRGAVAIERFAQNRVEMIQLAVSAGTTPTKHPLKELTLPKGALIAATLRDNELIIPGGDHLLIADDEVFVIGRTEVIKKVESIFGKRRLQKNRHIMLAGGGPLASSLIRALRNEKARVTVIEEDAARCEALAEAHAHVNVVHGEATDIDLLREEGIDTAEVFAALTREDEVNLLSSLLARQLKVRRTLTLTQKTEYAPIYRHLGVDATICPWLLVANQILRYLRPSELVSTSLLEGGRGEILEFRASDRSRILGQPLKALHFPRGAIIGAVMRDDDVFIPSGGDHIEAEDLVVVFALPKVRDEVAKLFGPKHLFSW